MNTYYTQVNLLYTRTTPMSGIAWYRLLCVSVTNKELLFEYIPWTAACERGRSPRWGWYALRAGCPLVYNNYKQFKQICHVIYEMVIEHKVMC